MARTGIGGSSDVPCGEKPIDELLERLLKDEDFKDTTIEFSDGTLRAHGSILAAGSDAVRGILVNGEASASRSLSWKEQDVSVGQFFLRLLYTGYASETDWQEHDPDEEGKEGSQLPAEPPMHLLLGSLSIAQVYQFVGILEQVVASVKRRLNADTFNDICKTAIQHDVQSIRTHCLLIAASGATTSGPWFPGDYRVIASVIVTKDFDLNSERLGSIDKHAMIQVLEVCGQRVRIEQPYEGWVSLISLSRKRLLEFCAAAEIKASFLANTLSPEVCYELRGLWGANPQTKRRRIAV